MKKFKKLRLIVFGLVCLSLGACMLHPRMPMPVIAETGDINPQQPRQALVAANESFLFWTFPKLYALEDQDGVWKPALEPMDAVIGRNGFAPPGEKREGDGRTPSGTFRLGTAFGYAPQFQTRMPYRQALPDDVWVDDPNAPDYNRWVKQNETQAVSYEKMKRDDDLYKYGLVIEYNTNPVTPGYGSAIFLHIRKDSGEPTAGCVAVSEKNILDILSWLDPAAHPVIIINPDENPKGENTP